MEMHGVIVVVGGATTTTSVEVNVDVFMLGRRSEPGCYRLDGRHGGRGGNRLSAGNGASVRLPTLSASMLAAAGL